MVWRAMARAFSLLANRPMALVVPSLQASLAGIALGLPWMAGIYFQWPPSARGLLSVASALGLWLIASWLFYSVRRALEDPAWKPGLKAFQLWLGLRLKERLLSFALAAAGLFWAGLALSFYRSVGQGAWWGFAGLWFASLVSLAALLALLLQLALSSRGEADMKNEWKAAFLMVLAYPLPSLAMLGMALLILLPLAFVLPVFGAGWLAAMWIGTCDEFLAAANQQEPPAFDRVSLKDWIKPWR